MYFKKCNLSFVLLLLLFGVKATAQSTLWQGIGRIVISADGNEHDHDDWAATPLSLAIIAAKKLQDKLPVYIYADHIWGSNHEHPGVNGITPYEQMKESALMGGKMFGFKKTTFICAVDHPELAYEALKEQVNMSTVVNPLFIIVAGPVQVIGEAVSRADSSKRKFVTIISTTDKWNNTHADEPYTKWENHNGWTLDKIKNRFASVAGGGIKIVLIQSQNKGLKRNWKEYEWLKTAPERNDPYYIKGSWAWLFNRLCMSTKPMGEDRDYYYAIDASDAGKVIYLLTGNDSATPRTCYEIMKTSTVKMPFPKLKDRTRKGIMSYLNRVIENQFVIVGQQCSETPDVATNYRKAFQSIYDSTGKYPALLGLDYGYFKNIDFRETNRFAINHWKKGGLVTISWHADNPFRDGYDVRGNSVEKKDSISLNKLLKNAPQSKERDSYRTELSKVANALRQLQLAGVVVLWRPFHEVNGNWFWWGINDNHSPTNQEAYKAIWQDMYETFTNEYGLTNLIWVYSPNREIQGGVSVSTMYPGAKWVDIVGVDHYTRVPEFKEYEELKRFNKLVVNGEIGPHKDSYGRFDELEVLKLMKGKAAYFLQWHSWNNAKVAIVDNLNFKEMMNHPDAITLDKIK